MVIYANEAETKEIKHMILSNPNHCIPDSHAHLNCSKELCFEISKARERQLKYFWITIPFANIRSFSTNLPSIFVGCSVLSIFYYPVFMISDKRHPGKFSRENLIIIVRLLMSAPCP